MLLSTLPLPKGNYNVHRDEDSAIAPTISLPNRNINTNIPSYPNRANAKFVPMSDSDYNDGGAYPEIHVVQYPLDMGRPGTKSTAIVAVNVDEKGQISYDALVKQGSNRNKLVQTSLDDIKEKETSIEKIALPDEKEQQETAEKTRLALEALLDSKIKSSKPSTVVHTNEVAEPTYIRYTPNPNAPGAYSNNEQRIIRMVEAQVDPMEPPKFKHKKAPRGPPSPPVPVLHSPPRKLTVADQQSWKIPPCISNWKNARGYTIPLDKRLAADGRGLQEVTINNKFAMLSEALYISERKASEDLRVRNQIRKKMAMKEKEDKEQELREMALKARMERSGLNPMDDIISNSRDDDDDNNGELEHSRHHLATSTSNSQINRRRSMDDGFSASDDDNNSQLNQRRPNQSNDSSYQNRSSEFHNTHNRNDDSMSGGRGRGRASTLPAWMTRDATLGETDKKLESTGMQSDDDNSDHSDRNFRRDANDRIPRHHNNDKPGNERDRPNHRSQFDDSDEDRSARGRNKTINDTSRPVRQDTHEDLDRGRGRDRDVSVDRHDDIRRRDDSRDRRRRDDSRSNSTRNLDPNRSDSRGRADSRALSSKDTYRQRDDSRSREQSRKHNDANNRDPRERRDDSRERVGRNMSHTNDRDMPRKSSYEDRDNRKHSDRVTKDDTDDRYKRRQESPVRRRRSRSESSTSSSDSSRSSSSDSSSTSSSSTNSSSNKDRNSRRRRKSSQDRRSIGRSPPQSSSRHSHSHPSATTTSSTSHRHISQSTHFSEEDILREQQRQEEIARQQREKLRVDKRKERERELRLENMKGNMRKNKLDRDVTRDVSEKIALGMHRGGGGQLTGEALFDSRLFNQTSGMDSGFNADDEYGVYSKPLFERTQITSIYRPKRDDADIYGDADTQLKKLSDTSKFQPDKGFQGTENAPRSMNRSAPVQFERAGGGGGGRREGSSSSNTNNRHNDNNDSERDHSPPRHQDRDRDRDRESSLSSSYITSHHKRSSNSSNSHYDSYGVEDIVKSKRSRHHNDDDDDDD